ncbi:2-oxo-4-hydroxy-4-carboxy-5-ureidoimidazoline decarboxylase [Paenibacillus wynnii]|uniref:2-oxo-4-hydroxy-4-carboxy-5-ureidoimidazoline decarboxylase n=1 Tax=Paenibacillus wynnii TaxID=268407 RepID=UPI002793992E|nr:2-oxo-4-hydroxy-4-carboxy-5-ureidoimidazoline decarboxylase [Paenibacillus wynnii]MDQ0194959.1 hydroxyisourate hydrolase [Paenibacillus wynnii]
MDSSDSLLTLEEINGMSKAEFVESLGGIFEHSPWVAEGTYLQAPFESVNHLHSSMLETARQADRQQIEHLLRAHPDLATKLQVSPLSAAEQQGAGLDKLAPEEFLLLKELNQTYTAKFQFPFILAVRGKTKDDIVSSISERVNRTLQEEWDQALSEIGRITRFRLNDLIKEDTKEPYGRLTTHVLDLARGIPAAELLLQLRRLTNGTSELLLEAVTNRDGRLDAPLLEGSRMESGCYELLFMVGDYFRKTALVGEIDTVDTTPFFLEQIPIRFNIKKTSDHYHVPLLVAPGGYSTYRGS